MKRSQLRTFLLISFAIILSLSNVEAQREPVTWHISIDSVTKTNAVVVCRAEILKGWHLYSQHIEEGGPMPTKFIYDEQGYTIVGPTSEKGKLTKYHDELYDMEVVWYSGEAMFSQRLQKNESKAFVRVKIEYMVCSGEVCMPFKKNFTAPIVAQ